MNKIFDWAGVPGKMIFINLLILQVKSNTAQAQADTLIPNSTIYTVSPLRPMVMKPHPFLLPIARSSVQGSYPLELSFTKTTHIVFPSKIKDFDAGSGSIMAMVPETILNVLRVKSDKRGFVGETNMTVFTDDGELYSFLVRYNENPDVFNLTIANNRLADQQTINALGINSGADNGQNTFVLPEGTYSEESLISHSQLVLDQRNFIRHIGARKNDFSILVRGIFLDQQQVMYLKMELKNRSYMPYRIDFIKLFVRDKNTVKQMAVQQEEIPVILSYPNHVNHLNGEQKLEKVLAIPYKTLEEGKVLEIELYEKGGGRHLTFQLTNETLLQIKPLL